MHDEAGEERLGRTVAVGVVCFVLGVVLALFLRPEKAPPPAPECPAAPPCPVCPEPTQASAAHPAPPRPATRPQRRPRPEVPLPAVADDAEAHRERLRDWFEMHSRDLLECVSRGDPRRKVLLQMSIEPDGRIADASLVGADDLRPDARACVVEHVRALRVPKEELRGRETLVVHVTL